MTKGVSARAAKENQFLFGSDFLHDHVGQIIDEPTVAILELVANCYDAGADRVEVAWPNLPGKTLSITDNGTGMNRKEFETRWRTLKYDRIAEQGAEVAFPSGVPSKKRTAFGHNGKGRFSPLCFADEYQVETWKDGQCTTALVELTNGGSLPFRCSVQSEKPKSGHGTSISAIARRNILPSQAVCELIGFKFAVDPSFVVTVNNQAVKLLSLTRLSTEQVEIEGYGRVTVYRLDPLRQERTTQLKGIAWWVNRRMVGEPSWDGLDGPGQYLDGRTVEAKRFSFVVEADTLKTETKPDWCGFKESEKTTAVRKTVHSFITNELRGLMADDRKTLKRAAIQQNRGLIEQLPPVSRRQVGRFIDEVQEKCPSLTSKELSRTIEILGKLEQSRSGYDLLRQLVACSSKDLDTWNSLMQRWTATNAEIVLGELERRLTVLKDLQELIRDKGADELHELQPLFERGLWMFGPEYEAVEFTSNRSMNTVVREFFQKQGVTASRSRPDFVVLPDSSIGAFGKLVWPTLAV
jgi:Histidine kinase-, DNA gyrase B-, and HSP90-like ATPase